MERYDRDAANNRQRRMRRFKLLLRLYMEVGIFIATIAFAYFGLTLFPYKLTVPQQISLMVAGVGIALALTSRTLTIYLKEREITRVHAYQGAASFLDAWARFERIGKQELLRSGEDFNIHSLRSVISKLYAEGKLDKEDLSVLEEALQLRNAIAHGDRPFLPVDERINDSLANIIKKITLLHSGQASS